jgi:hypothetical protein
MLIITQDEVDSRAKLRNNENLTHSAALTSKRVDLHNCPACCPQVAAAADAGVVQMTSFYLDNSMSTSDAQGMGDGMHVHHSEAGSESASSLLLVPPMQQQQLQQQQQIGYSSWMANSTRSGKVNIAAPTAVVNNFSTTFARDIHMLCQ